MRNDSLGTAVIAAASLLAAGCASPFYMGQQPSTQHREVGPRSTDSRFAAIETVAIVPVTTQPALDIVGDYDKETPTAGQGAAAGAGEAMNEMLFEDPRALLLAPIILPMAAIAGAASAKVQQQIQKMRDNTTIEIAESIEQEAPGAVIAEILQTRMQRVPDIDAELVRAGDVIPEEVDAILKVAVGGIIVDVESDNATLTTIVTATLTEPSDSRPILREYYEYSVKEDLGRWARNDYELLRDYGQGAHQYITRQISDEFFNRIQLRHVLRPVNTSAKDVLDWELILLGEEEPFAWANAISEADASYDLEIFDGSNLVFSAHNIRATEFEIPADLAPCTDFRWTVRPIYLFEGVARAGEWMAHDSVMRRMYASTSSPNRTGSFGDKMLAIREITEGYPKFKTRCH